MTALQFSDPRDATTGGLDGTPRTMFQAWIHPEHRVTIHVSDTDMPQAGFVAGRVVAATYGRPDPLRMEVLAILGIRPHGDGSYSSEYDIHNREAKQFREHLAKLGAPVVGVEV